MLAPFFNPKALDTIMLDSGALTAGTVSVSDDNERGAILAFHSIIGFAGGAIAGPIIGFILDVNGGTNNTSAWIFAFISMGLGSLFVFLIHCLISEIGRASCRERV